MRLRMHALRAPLVAVTAAVLTVALSAVPAAAEASGTRGLTCDGAWHIAPSANPASRFNDLLAVSAVSPSVAWAVGWGYGGGGIPRGLIERWDGTSWTGVPSPAAGHQGNQLLAVSAPDAGHAFAVGSRYVGDHDRTLVEQYDGVSWSVVPSPSRGSGEAALFGVSALTGIDAWAVGSHRLPSGSSAPLVEHWDGTAWSYVPSPSFHGSEVSFTDVAAVSSDDVWAVGSFSSVEHGGRSMSEHWNGTEWSYVPVDNPGFAFGLSSLTAVAADDVWAVGFNGTGGGPVAEHWDGSSWSVVPLENPGIRSEFLGVAVAGSSVYATGISDEQGVNTLAERWNGSSFQIVPTPNVIGHHFENWLRRAASDGTTIWAVGHHDARHPPLSRTLIEYVC